MVCYLLPFCQSRAADICDPARRFQVEVAKNEIELLRASGRLIHKL